MYPVLDIHMNRLMENAQAMLALCKKNHIKDCFLVTKVLAGHIEIVEALASLGFSHLADSRIQNLKTFESINLPKALVRIPMISEAKQVVRYAHLSLQSEPETIKAIDREANKQNVIHQIILMIDLGDLREGVFFEDNIDRLVEEILNLSNIKLMGIGTNLTCYGGVIPTKDHFNQLIDIQSHLQARFEIHLPMISAGNSSMIYLMDGSLPKEINSLRVGEAIFLGKETSFQQPIEGFIQDVFILNAELVEVKQKPSYPIGQIGLDSFGQVPHIKDQGMMQRGIAAIGKQDVDLNNLTPSNPDITILGGSSDHLILDLTKTTHRVGQIVSFYINYPGLLQLMTSPYVTKRVL